MKKYKSYRKQGLECDKNGNRFAVKVSYLSRPNVVLICVKHKTFCHSEVCLKERTGLIKIELKKLQKDGQRKLKQIIKKIKSS